MIADVLTFIFRTLPRLFRLLGSKKKTDYKLAHRLDKEGH
jgi:hypothetical protein